MPVNLEVSRPAGRAQRKDHGVGTSNDWQVSQASVMTGACQIPVGSSGHEKATSLRTLQAQRKRTYSKVQAEMRPGMPSIRHCAFALNGPGALHRPQVHLRCTPLIQADSPPRSRQMTSRSDLSVERARRAGGCPSLPSRTGRCSGMELAGAQHLQGKPQFAGTIGSQACRGSAEQSTTEDVTSQAEQEQTQHAGTPVRPETATGGRSRPRQGGVPVRGVRIQASDAILQAGEQPPTGEQGQPPAYRSRHQ